MNNDIRIFSKKTGEILLSPALPSLSDPGYISGVRSLGANGSFGYLLFQEITGNGYLIRYHSYYLNQDDDLTLAFENPSLRLFLGLKNSFHYTTKDLGEGILHERGFNISYTPILQQTLCLRSKRPYAYLGVHFSIEHMEQMEQLFPGVENFLHATKSRHPFLLNKVNQVADNEMLNVAEDILYCAYPLETRRKYLGNRVKEILILSMEKIFLHPLQKPISLPEKVVEKIYEARKLLIKDLKKTYTLDELSSLVDLSIYKLKKGFIAIYGLSVADFVHEVRMQKASLLLEETDLSISQIAEDTGYSHPFAFSSAFKKYFGYAPSLIQRGRKQAVQRN